ncbi:MAG: carboxypeptidase-like regulatory domain-containing protein, partial [Planctomycetota bacterium]
MIARLLSLTVFCVAQLPAPGRVTAVVVDEAGKLIPNAQVSIHRRGVISPGPPAARAPFNDAANSNASGAFTFAGVPDDSVLQVCVKVPDPQSLDTCLWDRHANRFLLAANEDRKLPQIRVPRGYLLTILITDPQGLLPARDWSKPRSVLAEDVVVTLRSPVIGLLPLPAQPAPGGGRRYEHLVPYDTPIPLNIYSSSGLLLTDPATGRKHARISR